MKITQKDFGKGTILYSLTNDQGMTLDVTNLGARIVHLFVPLENGKRKNIVLGFDSAEEYISKDLYFGATIGRVAGRIRKGQFSIDNQEFQLETDSVSKNTLHGGKDSFEAQIWQATTKEEADRVSVRFEYVSPEMEHGFPGTLHVFVTYTLTNENEWLVSYEAKTDQPTLFNPTNHVYFNLTGEVEKNVANHELFVLADKFAVVNEQTLVTGEFRAVEKTPFDFRELTPVKQVFDTEYEQNKLVNGLDHPFLLKEEPFDVVKAIIVSPEKDISVEMYTDAPAVVIFTAQLGEDAPIIAGKKMANHGGITLETQVSPGAIEYPELGNVILRPKETFKSQTKFKIVY